MAWNLSICPLHYFQGQKLKIIRYKRWTQSTHFIKQGSQRPNVSLEGVRLVFNYFRRKVVRRPHNSPCIHNSFLKDSGYPKITNFYNFIRVHEDVLSLQIAMDDFPTIIKNLPVMNVLDPQTYLSKPVQDLGLLEISWFFFGLLDF